MKRSERHTAPHDPSTGDDLNESPWQLDFTMVLVLLVLAVLLLLVTFEIWLPHH